MFRSCKRLFSQERTREVPVSDLIRTDTYVIHLLNTIVETAINYLQQLDEEDIKLVELHSQKFSKGANSVALLNRIKFVVPESGGVSKILHEFQCPDVLDSLDSADETLPKDVLLDYLKAAQALCEVLNANRVKTKEALLYHKVMGTIASVIQDVASINEHQDWGPSC